MEEPSKPCRGCNIVKPLTEFHRNNASRDGRITRCKACISAYTKMRHKRDGDRLRAESLAYYHTNRDTLLAKNRERARIRRETNPAACKSYRLKSEYGLSLGDWEALFESQGNACAACRATEPGGGRKLWHTDHCHATGSVRGILCASCNVALGLLRDSPKRLLALHAYLTRPSLTPGRSRRASSF